MGYWGWRPMLLALFISVWIAGCVATQETAPIVIPTESPAITLFVYTPAQSPTRSPLGLPTTTTIRPTATSEHPRTEVYRHTPVDDALLIRPTPTPLPLTLAQPTCFETADGGILCLGQVTNALPYPVEQVAVRVSVFETDGTLLRMGDTVVEQRVIPTGQAAPYRAQFPAGDERQLAARFGGAYATLLRAEDATQNAVTVITSLAQAEQGEWIDRRYVITVDLHNPGPEEVRSARIVATLQDEGGQVLGYRVVEMDAIPVGNTRSVQIGIVPAVENMSLRHTVYVEAER